MLFKQKYGGAISMSAC